MPDTRVCAQWLQWFPTLCDSTDRSPPGSSVRGILQQVYWRGLPFPSPGDPPDPGIEPASPVSPALQVDSFTAEPPTKPRYVLGTLKILLFNYFTR